MKLVCTKEEVNSLFAKKLVGPGKTPGSFQLNLKNSIGKEFSIPIELEKTTQVQTSLDLKTPDEKGHKNVEEWINEWRNGWRGLRKQGMGNKTTCIKNMKEFFLLNPTFTKDDVFKARDKYLKDQNGDYTYLTQADYFIKKRVPDLEEGGFKTRTLLLTYCEELEAICELGMNNQNSILEDDIYDDV